MAYTVNDTHEILGMDAFSNYADGMLSPAEVEQYEATSQIEMPLGQLSALRDEFENPPPLTELSNNLFSPQALAAIEAEAADYGQQFAASIEEMSGYWHVGTEGLAPQAGTVSEPQLQQPEAPESTQGVSMNSLYAVTSGIGDVADSISTQHPSTGTPSQGEQQVNTSRMSQYLGELGESFNEQGASNPEEPDHDPQDPRFRNNGPGHGLS